MQNFLGDSVKSYLKCLSEKAIVPGGGSAAALSASLGAGLNLMVVNYSTKPDDNAGKLEDFKAVQEKSLKSLGSLIDEDCKVFRKLMKAVSDMQGESGAQGEYIAAATVPLHICEECNRSMEVTEYLIDNANMNLVTDIGCAAHTIKSSFYAAKLNVNINLKWIKDDAVVVFMREKIVAMQKNIDRIHEEVIAKVDGIVNS